jgi:hypothetical protein
MYRSAMNKAIQVGRVTRILKRYALDCNLNRGAIIHNDLRPLEKIEDSQGQPRESVSLNDTPFSSICDWMECPYACATPIDVKKLFKDSQISAVSYDMYAMRWRESQIKQIIRNLFETQQQPMIQIDSLTEVLRAAEIPEVAIHTLLSEIIDQPSFRLRIHGQDGYITYRNTFYLFQPLRIANTNIPLALRIADTIVRKDEYESSKIVIQPVKLASAPVEKGEVKEVAPVVKEKSTTIPFWTECVKWATSIKDGTSELDIPPDLLKILYGRYSQDEYKHKSSYLSMISWMVESINALDKDKILYLSALGDVLIDIIWDETLTRDEQLLILKEPRNDFIKAAAEEQIVLRGDKEIFRSVSLVTGKIEYMCGEEKCSEIVVRTLESDVKDPLNNLKANNKTAGSIYGFLIPKLKDARLVFKTNERPVSEGVQPEKGGECEIVSSIDGHKKGLRAIRDMIVGNLHYPQFLLDEAVLNEKGSRALEDKKRKVDVGARDYKEMYNSSIKRGIDQKQAEKLATEARKKAIEKSPDRLKLEAKLLLDIRKFQNVIKACALKNIILRLIDKLEVKAGRLRYFYRPISAIKTNHRLK